MTQVGDILWQQVEMEDLYSGLYDGPHATPAPADDGPVFLGIKNITENGRLDLSQIRHIAPEDYAKWTKRVVPRPGDIVFSYEATLHRYAVVPEGFVGCLGRRMALIRPDPTRVNPRFLFYYFFGPEWRNTVASRVNIGATVDRIPLVDFPRFPVRVPALSVQEGIASVLSAYDNLIENNTRRSAILEEMAQAIYREWFVHFRFPGHEKVELVESELGPIPKGWQIESAKNLIKRLPKGTVYRQQDTVPEGSVVVIDQSRADMLGFHNNGPDFTASISKPLGIFGDHTCRMRLMVEPFSIGPNVVPFAGRGDLPLHYLFFLLNGLVETREYKRHWNDLMGKKIAVAPGGLARSFADTVEPFTAATDVLRSICRVLQRTRNLLLPKLISGEINVSELDIDTSGIAA